MFILLNSQLLPFSTVNQLSDYLFIKCLNIGFLNIGFLKMGCLNMGCLNM